MSNTHPIPLPLQLRPTRSRKLGLVVAYVGLTIACLNLVLTGSVLLKALGLFGLVFFGYSGVKLKRQGRNLAGLALYAHGVQLLGWNLVIPWSEVTGVGTTTVSHNKCVGINLASYDRFAASVGPGDLKTFHRLQKAIVPLGLVALTAGEVSGDLIPFATGSLQKALATTRRQTGWDLYVMRSYLDRTVREAATLLSAVREQQAGPFPPSAPPAVR